MSQKPPAASPPRESKPVPARPLTRRELAERAYEESIKGQPLPPSVEAERLATTKAKE